MRLNKLAVFITIFLQSMISYASFKSTLQPLDILLSKNSGASSHLIPGYFSHSAVYLGNEEQLKELGIWQKEYFENYRSDIQEGRVIIEAITPHVRLVSVEEFLANNQEVLNIRKSDSLVNLHLVSDAYERALLQMFKPYDFLLNLKSNNKIFCAELVSIIYKNINWPIRYGFGIYSLKPDNFAEVALHIGSKFQFVSYHSNNLSESYGVDTAWIAEKIGYVWRDINAREINNNHTKGYYWDRQVRLLGIRLIKRAEGIKTVIIGNPTCREALTLYQATEVDTL